MEILEKVKKLIVDFTPYWEVVCNSEEITLEDLIYIAKLNGISDPDKKNKKQLCTELSNVKFPDLEEEVFYYLDFSKLQNFCMRNKKFYRECKSNRNEIVKSYIKNTKNKDFYDDILFLFSSKEEMISEIINIADQELISYISQEIKLEKNDLIEMFGDYVAENWKPLLEKLEKQDTILLWLAYKEKLLEEEDYTYIKNNISKRLTEEIKDKGISWFKTNKDNITSKKILEVINL